MKIPLIYPKIPDTTNCPLKKCVIFEKYDGTNLHWVWKPNVGWTSFGTRRDSFSLDDNGIAAFNKAHPELHEAPAIFLRTYGLLNDSPHELILFTEFLGENSFAGQHQSLDKKKLILFDASVNGKLLNPQEFLASFATYHAPEPYEDECETPAIIYSGKYSGQLVEDIRKGKYPVNEGVVIKGVVAGQVYLAKVKTDAYMLKLKTQFKNKWQDYWE